MKRRTKEEMFSLLRKWKKSEQSKSDFCRQHGMKLGVFYYWLSKLEKEKEKAKQQGKFISMHLPKKIEPHQKGLIEIYYPNGVRMLLHELTDLSVLPMLSQWKNDV